MDAGVVNYLLNSTFFPLLDSSAILPALLGIAWKSGLHLVTCSFQVLFCVNQKTTGIALDTVIYNAYNDTYSTAQHGALVRRACRQPPLSVRTKAAVTAETAIH